MLVPTPKNCDRTVSKAIQLLSKKLEHCNFYNFTASRLIATDANKKFTSVLDFTNWIAGTTNQITVTDDTDGTVTLSTPQDIHTGATNFTVAGESIISATSTTTALNIKASGDAANRFQLRADGLMEWGDGTNAVDTNLYRSNANELKTDDLFWADNLYADTDIAVRNAGRLICLNTANTHFVSFKVDGALAATTGYTLPSADGSNGQFLQTNGSATLSWATATSTFLALTDTPASYNTNAGEFCVVNSGENAIEFRSEVLIYGTDQVFINDSLYLAERASALGDVAGRGQIWVKNTTPCELWFTDDAGTDTQLGVAGSDEKVKIDASATAGYIGAAYNDGVLRTVAGLSYTDGGDYVTVGGFTSTAKAYRSATQSVNDSTWTKVQLNAESWDGDGEFDSSTNYRFTATNAGTYLITAKITFESMGAADHTNIGIYVNGAQDIYNNFQVATASNHHTFISYTRQLSASDYVELWAHHKYGSARNVSNGSSITYLVVTRVQ